MNRFQVSPTQKYRNSIPKSQDNIDHAGLGFLYDSVMEIKDWVLKARKAGKLTQEQLGDHLGVTKGNISAWENGRHEPSWTQLLKISSLTGVSPPMQETTTPSESEFALVPELDVLAACGPNGKFTDHVVVKGGLAFKHSFLSEVGVPENQARVVHADGPSMEPTIGHGRVVLVNLADTMPKDGKVYLICDEDGGISLKRLVRDFDPGMGATVWKIRSDNPDKRRYPDKFWPEDSRAHIIGRAVWHDGLL